MAMSAPTPGNLSEYTPDQRRVPLIWFCKEIAVAGIFPRPVCISISQELFIY